MILDRMASVSFKHDAYARSRMDSSETPGCPVCSLRARPCPLFPAWGVEPKMEYLFEYIKGTDSVDPEVYRFWLSAVEHYVEHKGSFSFTHEEIMLTYKRREVITALGIGRVLHEALQRNDVVSISGMSGEGGSARFSLVRWVVNTLVVTPISAAWSYVTSGDDAVDAGAGNVQGGAVVGLKDSLAIARLLKTSADAVVAYFDGKMDVERTTTLDLSDGAAGVPHQQEVQEQQAKGDQPRDSGLWSFREACRAAGRAASDRTVGRVLDRIDHEGCTVLACFMVANGLAVRDGLMIKVVGAKGQKRITDADRKVLDFRVRVSKLEGILAVREAEMRDARSKAAALHKQGLSHQASIALVRYKKLEQLVTKLRGGVLNLLTLHYSIEGVSTDVEVFAGLRGGTEALKRQREESGVTVRDVDDAMVEAAELMDEQRELDAALGRDVSDRLGGVDEEELLKELEALEITEPRPTPQQPQLDLPDVSTLPPPSVGLRGERQTPMAEMMPAQASTS